ncbi:MAG: pantoate--beta-alanine ligase [Rhodobacteraceae bacterium]|jgi:pantoate--beta-alanine ligase|uniref:pantoate--beta-alanine ligase n=1 Tax=uncultured Planktomarina sp. TaxID=1538529 RepID=UPI0029FFFA96|nr:pantoate--beta-alanine ligase [Paracoccaceae bacterium]
MQICPSKIRIGQEIARLRAAGKTIGLVPTMGFLHAGHLQLMRRAAQNADAVVATIFVNPTQFGANEDLSRYPRDLDRDLALLRDEGVAAVFTPSPEEMYLPGADTIVDVPSLSGILQGALRPGHFQGVATVVSKLFNITQPDVAVFGEKDYQQLALIRKMVRDLDVPVRIIGHPTAREDDGLAMSSRNVRLSPAQRAAAKILNAALTQAEHHPQPSAEAYVAQITQHLAGEALCDIKSVEIRDSEDLTALSGPLHRPAVILLAVAFGDVLLIDQRVIDPRKDSS